jgi:hypothetical protein
LFCFLKRVIFPSIVGVIFFLVEKHKKVGALFLLLWLFNLTPSLYYIFLMLLLSLILSCDPQTNFFTITFFYLPRQYTHPSIHCFTIHSLSLKKNMVTHLPHPKISYILLDHPKSITFTEKKKHIFNLLILLYIAIQVDFWKDTSLKMGYSHLLQNSSYGYFFFLS